MASRRIFDPLTLLRLTPAITAAASVTFAGNQHWILEMFTRPEFARQNNLPLWLDVFFKTARPKMLGLLATTVLGAALNLGVGLRGVGAAGELHKRGALGWYVAGAVLAASHLAFTPAAGRRVRGVVESKSSEAVVGELRGWLKVNAVRSLTADMGAWVCFVVAAVKALQ